MTKIICPSAIIAQTIARLQDAGDHNMERVVLWLAPLLPAKGARVVELYEPDQEAREDIFRVGPESMKALMAYLRSNRLRAVAQVHSHPHLAFHSAADDRWALIRHKGALSLVLPYFAKHTRVDNFMGEVAIFVLSQEDRWVQVPASAATAPMEIQP
jgi:hypothetical protein